MQLHKMALTDNLSFLINKANNFIWWSLFITEGTKRGHPSHLNNFAFCFGNQIVCICLMESSTLLVRQSFENFCLNKVLYLFIFSFEKPEICCIFKKIIVQ